MTKQLEVTLVKSMIGRPQAHRKVLFGMGLRRRGRTVVLRDTPAIRGMIAKVAHLVETKEKI
ncbi:MAG: 50S ribosomal protein L30 [Deltaproteobacteria bacterium]|nr:50S ribosomal protein L30 [Deltaproteobacteria bacterium]MBW1955719.1 50S ribosomal protein L30 [Deltaproteobacteria bacterium]MBW2041413.1 50S ribosomal protein L30 [Deltaproteobacteria bacterium]MBW2133087.1 50S ribosomal protein L30 [Deltaproteobacteria bacterium]